jgi:hypothetical protein
MAQAGLKRLLVITVDHRVYFFDDAALKPGQVEYFAHEGEPWQPSIDGWVPGRAAPRTKGAKRDATTDAMPGM